MPKQFANLDNLETFKNSFENWVNGTKGDTLTYNEDTSVLQLKAGSNILSSVEISGGGSSLKIGDVSGASVTTSGQTITLKWSDPSDIVISDVPIVVWKGTKVVRKVGSAPSDRNDGVTVVDNQTRNQYSSTGFTDTGLTYGTTYYYRFFPYTDDYKYTDGSAVSVTPTLTVISVVPSQNGTLTYDGTEKTASFSDYDPAKMTIVDDSDKATTAGTHTAYFLPNTGYCWSDYSTTTKSVDWAIGKASLTKPEQSGTMTYDGTEQTASWDSNYDSTKMSVINNTGTNAGSYTATFSITDSNYEWSDGSSSDKTSTWSIAKASFTTSVSISGYTYAGTKSTPSVLNNPGNGSVTYYGRSTSSGTSTEWSNVTSTTYNAGTRYIYAVIAETANYNGYTTANTSFTIAKASFTATVSISGYTYAGTKSTPSVSNNPGNGSVTYYGRSTSTGTATAWSNVTSTTYNAGTRYCYAVIAETTNYNSYTTANKSFTISKASFTATVSISGYTYAGTKSTPSVSNNPGGGTVTYYGRSTSSGTATAWSNVTSTTYDAGTRYCYAVIEASTNYNSYTTGNTSFTISKASSSFSLSKTSVSLDNSTTYQDITISNIVGSGSFTLSSSNPTIASVSWQTTNSKFRITGNDTGSSTVTVTMSSSTNYESSSKTISVTCEFGVKIVSFSSGTDSEIKAMLDAYYANEITWAEMGWAVGDTRVISLGSMNRPNGSSADYTWGNQNITVVIVDHDHTTLATSNNGHTKSCITVQFREALAVKSNSGSSWSNAKIFVNGVDEVMNTFIPWSNIYMRTWLNGDFLASFSSSFRQMIKPSKHYRRTTAYNSTSSEQVTDTIFLPSYPEVYGSGTSASYYNPATNPTEGTQFSYYETSSNRIKKTNHNGAPNNSQYVTWWLGNTSYPSGDEYSWGSVSYSAGNASKGWGTSSLSLAPAWAM